MVLDSLTQAKLYHKFSRTVGTNLVVGCPILDCIFCDTGPFVGSLCQLGYGIKNAKVHMLIQVGAVDYLLALTFLVFLGFLYAISVIADTFTLSEGHSFIFWILAAVTIPLIGTFASLALLVAIYLPISATCILYHKWHQYQEIDNQAHEDELNTINRSDPVDLPSHTTWDPPHSTPFGLVSSNKLHVANNVK